MTRRKREPKLEFDCTSCGACCVAPYAGRPWVDLLEADVERLKTAVGTRRLRRLVVLEHGVPCTEIKVDRAGHTVCAALRGVVGKNCQCSVYEARPDACRAFEPGSEGCWWSRSQLEEAGFKLEPPREAP